MKRLLLIVILFLSVTSSYATHLMGGEIVAKYDSTSGKYVVKLTHYRDTLGIPLYTSITLNYYSDSMGTYTLLFTNNVNLDTALSQTLLPNFPYGVEVGVYVDSVNLSPGQYHITNETCCRNGAILNMTTPLSESLVLYTNLQVDSSNNSSPDFMAMPVAHFPINQPATYNPLPFDPDGDSISWSLNTPIGSTLAGTSQLINVSGFSAPAADTSGPFTINPVTGEITWIPDSLGNYVQSFEVTEYKNGVASGKIIRDMQYVIVPSGGNSSPFYQSVTPYNTNITNHYYYYYYTPGQQMSFTLNASDIDSNTNLSFQIFGQIMNMINPATFAVTGTGMNKNGTLKWTPPANYSKDEIVVFRVGDGQVIKDFTLLLRKKPTGIEAVNNIINEMIVYPNPAKNKININLQVDKDINTDISMYSLVGEKVANIYHGKLVKGNVKLDDDINLSKGVYFVLVKVEGQVVKAEKIIIE